MLVRGTCCHRYYKDKTWSWSLNPTSFYFCLSLIYSNIERESHYISLVVIIEEWGEHHVVRKWGWEREDGQSKKMRFWGSTFKPMEKGLGDPSPRMLVSTIYISACLSIVWNRSSCWWGWCFLFSFWRSVAVREELQTEMD